MLLRIVWNKRSQIQACSSRDEEMKTNSKQDIEEILQINDSKNVLRKW